MAAFQTSTWCLTQRSPHSIDFDEEIVRRYHRPSCIRGKQGSSSAHDGRQPDPICFWPSQIVTKIRHSTAYIDHLSPKNKEVAIASYTAALRIVFICQIVLAGLALLSVAGITEVDLPDRAKPKPVNAEEEEV